MPRIEGEPPKLWYYALRWSHPDYGHERAGWAQVVLGSNGYFSCISDWDSVAFGWPHHGETPPKDFRWFFLNVFRSIDYVAGKFFKSDEPQLEYTIERVREYLMNLRNVERRIQKDQWETWDFLQANKGRLYGAKHPWYGTGSYVWSPDGCHGYREEADKLKELEDGEIDIRAWLDFTHIPDAHEYVSYDYPVNQRTFLRGFLPELAAIIADELEAEGHDVSEYRTRRAEWEAKRYRKEQPAT